MLALLIKGIGLGWVAGITPGSLNTYLIAESARNGWRAGVRVAISPLITDLPIMFLMMVLLGQLPERALAVIGLIGAGVLLYLAWGLLGQWRSGVVVSEAEIESTNLNRSLWQGVLINLTNPNPYLFWGTVGVPLLLGGWNVSPLWAGVFLLGFYGVFMATTIGLAVMSSQLRRLPSGGLRWLWLIGAVVLAGLALLLVVDGVGRL